MKRSKGIFIIPFFVLFFIIQSIGLFETNVYANTSTINGNTTDNEANIGEIIIPDIKGALYIQDSASYLTPEQEKKIIDIGDSLQAKTSAEVVLLTIPSLNGNDQHEYALKAFEKYKLGTKENENGVLILFSIEKKNTQVITGYGLEQPLNDSKIGRLIDQNIDKTASDEEIINGLIKLYSSISQEITEFSDEEGITGTGGKDTGESMPVWLIIVIVVVFVILVILDFKFTGGMFTELLIRLLFIILGRGGGNNDSSGGSGGSTGGGGAGR